MDQKDLGKRIRALRESSGLTQKQFANLCEMGTTAISKLELGRTRRAHPATWARMLNVLHVTREEIYNPELTISDLVEIARKNREESIASFDGFSSDANGVLYDKVPPIRPTNVTPVQKRLVEMADILTKAETLYRLPDFTKSEGTLLLNTIERLYKNRFEENNPTPPTETMDQELK